MKTDEDRGSSAGAMRHAIWQAAITAEYGFDVAKEVGDAHEQNPGADLSIRVFSDINLGDEVVDLLNNEIGRLIGLDNQGKPMNEIALEVLEIYKSEGLYTMSKNENGDWEISKTPLSTEQYNALKNIFMQLDHNARYPYEYE